MSVFLGVDGGGSGTEACVVSAGGRVLAKGTGGPSNVYYSLQDVFRGSVATAVREALAHAGSSQEEVAMACVALAGAGRQRDAERAGDLLRPLFDKTPFFVVEDTRAALAAAHGAEDGIVLVAGTGSNCLGHKGGRYASSGGWGGLLGDEGSAYGVAVKGLRSAARSSDGRAPATSMLDGFLKALGGRSPQDLIPLTHGLDRSALAGLSRIVFEASASGDPAATDILDEEARELALMACAVAERLGMEKAKVGLVGGCFRNEAYIEALKRHLETAGARLEMTPVTRSPSEGAAILARDRSRKSSLQGFLGYLDA